jgi:hypothetical protein
MSAIRAPLAGLTSAVPGPAGKVMRGAGLLSQTVTVVVEEEEG